MICNQILENGQQNTLLGLVVVMHTLVFLEEVSTTIQTFTQLFVITMLQLEAIIIMVSDLPYICSSERTDL